MISSLIKYERDTINSVALYLNGIELNPDQITGVLLLDPTKCFRRGDVHITSIGSKVVRKLGIWSYKMPRDIDIIEQIIGLLDLLEKHSFDLHKFTGVDNAYISIFSAKQIIEQSVTFEFNLDLNIIQRVNKLGLSLRFELCGVEDQI